MTHHPCPTTSYPSLVSLIGTNLIIMAAKPRDLEAKPWTLWPRGSAGAMPEVTESKIRQWCCRCKAHQTELIYCPGHPHGPRCDHLVCMECAGTAFPWRMTLCPCCIDSDDDISLDDDALRRCTGPDHCINSGACPDLSPCLALDLAHSSPPWPMASLWAAAQPWP